MLETFEFGFNIFFSDWKLRAFEGEGGEGFQLVIFPIWAHKSKRTVCCSVTEIWGLKLLSRSKLPFSLEN